MGVGPAMTILPVIVEALEDAAKESLGAVELEVMPAVCGTP